MADGLLSRFCCSGTDVSAKTLAVYADPRTPSVEPHRLACGFSQSEGMAKGQLLVEIKAYHKIGMSESLIAQNVGCSIEEV